jgi:hypothetical protein
MQLLQYVACSYEQTNANLSGADPQRKSARIRRFTVHLLPRGSSLVVVKKSQCYARRVDMLWATILNTTKTAQKLNRWTLDPVSDHTPLSLYSRWTEFESTLSSCTIRSWQVAVFIEGSILVAAGRLRARGSPTCDASGAYAATKTISNPTAINVSEQPLAPAQEATRIHITARAAI